jgi:hypothetical protein
MKITIKIGEYGLKWISNKPEIRWPNSSGPLAAVPKLFEKIFHEKIFLFLPSTKNNTTIIIIINIGKLFKHQKSTAANDR